MWNKFKTLDPLLFIVPLLLLPVSVIVIYTLTINSQGSSLYIHQAMYAAAGVVLMAVATFIDYRSLKSWASWLYVLGLLGLIAVKLVGKSDFGAQRWISIGFFQLQPAEGEKIIMIIVLAALLAKGIHAISFSRFATLILLLLVPVLAIVLQPDLGTAIVISAIGIGMVFQARITRIERWVLIGGIALLVGVFALSFHGTHPFSSLLKGYQKDRLASFIDPSRDQSESGYNVLQSVIAVGSGGITGQGLGAGTQSQLNFLPVAYSDFIFAGISEAWGLIGSWGIIALYGILLWRVLQAARIAKDEFGMLLCIGVMLKIGVEVLVNVGMNIRLMPVTGIPLPFLSYGGTTLLVNAIAIGLVQSVVIRYKRLTF
ncbi:rod shape-determining protein RodA [Patescibacteria group bacterium]|nr:rod shape-determining protein RodA [Patescibacteria group bacterium]